MVDYISQEFKNIEGSYNKRNSFVCPIAIEENLDFSHRITFQSGKFTINGSKRPFENVKFKNLFGNCKHKVTTAEINMDKNKLISDLKIYLNDFAYTDQFVLRLGGAKCK